uniref:Uncharacterized protein n=1 Tax=Sphaerodactylus townsendi TaxID=933632 RepID=A0ACB8FJ10_9SAUR
MGNSRPGCNWRCGPKRYPLGCPRCHFIENNLAFTQMVDAKVQILECHPYVSALPPHSEFPSGCQPLASITMKLHHEQGPPPCGKSPNYSISLTLFCYLPAEWRWAKPVGTGRSPTKGCVEPGLLLQTLRLRIFKKCSSMAHFHPGEK